MQHKTIRQKRRVPSLAKLEDCYFSQDMKAACREFERVTEKRKDWAVIKAGQGTPSRRTDLPERSGISYVNYSPPAFWQPTYAVLLATLDRFPRADYVSHAGEEIAVPVEGKIHFHFFWSPGGNKPEEYPLKDIGFGSVLRLNPDVPHHAWGVGRPAKAWLLMRHASNTETAVSTDADMEPSNNTKPHSSTKVLTAEDLRKPGRYALTAWGLAAKLKGHRERADLTIKKVASECGIDHGQLSRIESGETNLRIDMLLKLAKYLRVDIGEVFSAPTWHNFIEPLWSSQPPELDFTNEFKSPGSRHLLHVTSRGIPARGDKGLRVVHNAQDMQDAPMSSHIVLSGRVIVQFDGEEELLSPGAVLHMRGEQSANIQALDDCVLLEVIYSRFCTCRKVQQARRS